ncbi:MAG: formyltransferase family protein [bacterium]
MLNRLVPVKRIVCERRAFSADLYSFAQLSGADFVAVAKRDELNSLVVAPGSVGLSCGFGLIFTGRHIAAFEHGIWNIHYGKLPDIRGRHPISWAFLRGDDRFYVSIHQVSEEIDKGLLLAQDWVPRDLNDTEAQVREKIETKLEQGLLKEALENYRQGRHIELDDGTYYPSLNQRFDNVAPSEHDSKFLFNLFRSQAFYGGVTVDGENRRECVFFHPEFGEHYEQHAIYECRDGVKVAIK